GHQREREVPQRRRPEIGRLDGAAMAEEAQPREYDDEPAGGGGRDPDELSRRVLDELEFRDRVAEGQQDEARAQPGQEGPHVGQVVADPNAIAATAARCADRVLDHHVPLSLHARHLSGWPRSRRSTTTRRASRSALSPRACPTSRATEWATAASTRRVTRASSSCAGCSVTNRAATPTCTAASWCRPTARARTSARSSGTRTGTRRPAATAPSRSAPGRSNRAAWPRRPTVRSTS